MKKSFVAIPVAALVLMMSLIAIANAQYGQSVVSYAAIGSGAVNSPNNILGSAPNGAYTQLYGGNPGDGGTIDVYLNAQVASGSAVKLYCYSASGYYSHTYVYVSNDNINWYQVSNGYVSGGPGWVNFGNAPIAFRYVAVAVYDDQGYSANLFVDCINSP